jgi:polysaccharide transporter, PST family
MPKSQDPGNSYEAPADLGDLKRKSVRGGMITLFSQGISILIQLASTVILSRLLSPNDYGTVAMVLAITSFVGMFNDLGLSSAAIQKKDLTDAQQSNLFWLNVAMGTTLSVIIALAAPLVARFYGRSELLPITLALSPSLIIASLGAQHHTRLVREMQFIRKATATIAGSIVALGVAVICARNGLAYWSLVWSNLTGAAVTTTLVFVLSPFWPSWYRKGAGIRSMVGFGVNISGFNIVNYLHRNLDNVLIGRFWGSGPLGLYSKAYSLLMFPNQTVRGPINAVAFPALSKLQGNPEAFRIYYRRITLAAAAISMPIAAYLFVLANPLITVALGEQWLEAATTFQILALVAFIQPSSSFRGVVVKSLGRSRDYLHLGVLEAAFTSTGFCIGVVWGANGVAISYVVSIYLVMPLLFYIAFRDAPVKFADFLRAVRYPAIASGLAGLSTWGLLHVTVLQSVSPSFQLGLSAAFFTLAYVGIFTATKDGMKCLTMIREAIPARIAAKITGARP